MSHIQIDLKVIEVHAPMVARATGIHEDRIIAGLIRLWHRCWSVAGASLSVIELAGVFGPENLDQLINALCVEFLEKQEDGSLRVRGADQYLRIKEARRRGALVTNKLLAERRSSVAPASLPNALTPNTEHRTPLETTMSSSLDLLPVEPQRVKPPLALEDKLTDDEFQVFEHWRATRHPRAKATPERKRLIAKALKVYSVADLQLAITGVTKSPHHMGENGTRTVYDDIELILRDAKHIESFLRLAGGGR